MNGLSFETGYVYHSGPFLSKVFRGICNTLILREDGLSNYIPHNVSLSKGIIRALFGLSYRDQVWGEEKWIHMIEVERPVDLPQRVRHKAREYSFGNLLHHTSTETKNLLKKTFLLDVLDLNKNKKTCIILTQPVDDDKYCSTELKMELYNIIAKKFLDRDYLVYLKQHPKEKAYSIPGTLSFPSNFPIELLPYICPHPFDSCVALCSTSLSIKNVKIADREIQCIPLKLFTPYHSEKWLDIVKKIGIE